MRYSSQCQVIQTHGVLCLRNVQFYQWILKSLMPPVAAKSPKTVLSHGKQMQPKFVQSNGKSILLPEQMVNSTAAMTDI